MEDCSTGHVKAHWCDLIMKDNVPTRVYCLQPQQCRPCIAALTVCVTDVAFVRWDGRWGVSDWEMIKRWGDEVMERFSTLLNTSVSHAEVFMKYLLPWFALLNWACIISYRSDKSPKRPQSKFKSRSLLKIIVWVSHHYEKACWIICKISLFCVPRHEESYCCFFNYEHFWSCGVLNKKLLILWKVAFCDGNDDGNFLKLCAGIQFFTFLYIYIYKTPATHLFWTS